MDILQQFLLRRSCSLWDDLSRKACTTEQSKDTLPSEVVNNDINNNNNNNNNNIRYLCPQAPSAHTILWLGALQVTHRSLFAEHGSWLTLLLIHKAQDAGGGRGMITSVWRFTFAQSCVVGICVMCESRAPCDYHHIQNRDARISHPFTERCRYSRDHANRVLYKKRNLQGGDGDFDGP